MTLSYNGATLLKFGPNSRGGIMADGFDVGEGEGGGVANVMPFQLTDKFNNGFYTEDILPRVINGGGVKGTLFSVNQRNKTAIEFGLIPTHYLEHILQNCTNDLDINPFKYGFVRITDDKLYFGLKNDVQRIDCEDGDTFEFQVADNKLHLYVNEEFKYTFDKIIVDDLTFFCLLKHNNPEVFKFEQLVIADMQIKTI
jgi:hypothetical protein